METAGKRCLVTGASSGIGRAAALALARRGATVVAHGRDEERLARVAARTGGPTVSLDLLEPGAPLRLAELAGPVDVLVASAGVGLKGPAAELDLHDLDRLVALNVTATIATIRAVLPAMLRRRSGHVVVVGSIAGRLGRGEEAAYAATKAAASVFVDSLQEELLGTGVAASVVTPGVVDTPFFERRGAEYDRSWPRPIDPDRVAGAIVTAIEARRRELTVPEWLSVATRVRDAAPSLYRAFAARLG